MLNNIFEQLITLKNDHLYRNSFFIILTSLFNSLIGFVFWIFASRMYSTEYVGLNTAAISLIFIIVYISSFGFDQSIIRFFPKNDRSDIFSTAIITSLFFSIFFGITIIYTISFWSPDLIILKEHTVLFISFVLANVITFLSGTAFIAVRKSHYYFAQTMVIGSRVLLLFPFIIFGELGILNAVGVSLIIATIFSAYFLHNLEITLRKFDFNFLRESFSFGIGNYITGFFNMGPTYILPIIVLNVLGPVNAAYYYIAFAIFSILSFIPTAFGTSLFVEGSHGEELRHNTLKSLKLSSIILIPIVLLIFLFGDYLLAIFGKSYVEGFNLLKILSISVVFVLIYQTFFSIKKVKKDVKSIMIISTINFLLIMVLSYVLMLNYGIIGVGYGWLISYFITSILILFNMRQNRWI